MLMCGFFLKDPAKSCQKSWQLPLARSWGLRFGPKNCCRRVFICSRWSNLSKQHGWRMNGKSWQYELQHRHAETGSR